MDIFRNARQNFLRRQAEDEQADLERQQAREGAMRLQSQERQRPSEPEMLEQGLSPLVPPSSTTGPSPASSVLRRFGDLPRPSMPSFLSRQPTGQQENATTTATATTTISSSFPRPASSYYTSHYSSSRFSDDGDDEESRVGFPPRPGPGATAPPQTAAAAAATATTHPSRLRNRYDLDDNEEVSPKTPQFAIGMPPLPSTRLHLPNLQRTWTQGSNGPPSRPDTARSFLFGGGGGNGHHLHHLHHNGAPAHRDQLPLLEDPVPAVPATHIHGHSGAQLSNDDFIVVVEDNEEDENDGSGHHRHHRSRRRRFNGTDPAEVHLMEMAEEGRRRRRRRHTEQQQQQQQHRHGHRHRHHRHNRERSGSGSHSRSNSNSNSNSNSSSGRHERRHRRHRRHEAAAAAGGNATTAEGASSSSSSSSSRSKKHPKRFLLCIPWVRSYPIRSYIMRCFLSGIALLFMLGIYLTLLITKAIANSEFSILLLLIILFTAIFLCHGLIRLCMLVMRPKAVRDRDPEQAPGYGLIPARGRHNGRNGSGPFEQDGRHVPGGYAIPRRPIRVVLARDEEAAGIESVATKIQPPAYGLWRESVRVDPNRIYWQRNDAADMPPIDEMTPAGRALGSSTAGDGRRDSADLATRGDRSPGPGSGPHARSAMATDDDDNNSNNNINNIDLAHGYGSGPRPPSYASEDGVSYVVEAQPRSIAPTTATGTTEIFLPNMRPIAPTASSETLLPMHPAEAGRGGMPAAW